MSELIVIPALIGSALAGLYDLRTTEVPDDIPALMIASGVFYWFVSALTFGDFYPLFLSLSLGALVLAAGLFLYRKGQWGEADAWTMAAIAFMVPLYNGGIFMAGFAANFLIVAAAYTVSYAIVLGFMHRDILPHFARDMRSNARILAAPAGFAALAVILRLAYGADTSSLIVAAAVFLLLLVFWRYGKVVESRIFRRRVASSRLKEGDVVEGMIWRGLTRDEIRGIRKKSRYVVVKEGVRFIPVFPLSLAVTLLYGNLFFIIV